MMSHSLWHRCRWFVPAAIVVVLMRLRFFFTPITTDEGGFLAIGRWWSHGAVPYRDVFVDRPQGLLLLYRLLVPLGLDRPNGVRLLALVFCLVGCAACGCVAARLSGGRSALFASLSVGVLASIPRLEGFIANGELLSGAVSALAVAVVLRALWERQSPHLGWLALAGVLAGCALTIKQSGFDGLVVGVVALAIAARQQHWTRAHVGRSLALLLAGLAVPVGLVVVHGGIVAGGEWWFDVVRYRSLQRSLLRGASARSLLGTGRTAAPLLIVAAALVALWIVHWVRREGRAGNALVSAWLSVAIVAFLSGGQFYRHYWILLMFPLGTALALACSQLAPARAWQLIAAALVLPLGFSAYDVARPRADVGSQLSLDHRLVPAERIARWFRANAGPGSSIYGLCSGGALYGNLRVDPPFPHLWIAEIQTLASARRDLVQFLASEQRPTYVAVLEDPGICDPSGGLRSTLDANYRVAASFDGWDVFERRS